MTREGKAIVICGAFPLLLGSMIYATWSFTRWSWLEVTGMIVIAVGTLMVTIGTGLLARYLSRIRRIGSLARNKNWIKVFLASGLLLANFPVAIIYTISAIQIKTRYTLRVSNESGNAIESLLIKGPGVRMELGQIAPGQKIVHELEFSGDGSLDFVARQRQHEFSGTVDEYVTGGWSGDTTIRVMPNRQFLLIKKQK